MQQKFLDASFKEVTRRGKLSQAEFINDFLSKRKPVIVSGIQADKGADTNWDPSSLAKRFGETRVKVKTLDDGREREETLAGYVKYLTGKPTKGPLRYMVDWDFKQRHPELLADVSIPNWCHRDYLRFRQTPSFWPTLFIGPAGSFSPVHVDLYHSHAWNTVLHGHKRFLLFSPADSAKMAGVLRANKKLSATLASGNLFSLATDMLPGLQALEPLVADLRPGDTLFTPCLWFHGVINLELTVAVTGNWVDQWCPKSCFDSLGTELMVRGIRESLAWFSRPEIPAPICDLGLERLRHLLLQVPKDHQTALSCDELLAAINDRKPAPLETGP